MYSDPDFISLVSSTVSLAKRPFQNTQCKRVQLINLQNDVTARCSFDSSTNWVFMSLFQELFPF